MKFKEFLKESAKDNDLLNTIMIFGNDRTKPLPADGGGTAVEIDGGDGKKYTYIVKAGVAKEYVESKTNSKKFNPTKQEFNNEKDLKARVAAVVDGL